MIEDQRTPSRVTTRVSAAWLRVTFTFVAASAFQVVIYGWPRLWGDYEPTFSIPRQLYKPLVYFFFFGPGLLAALVSFWLLRSYYRERGLRLPTRVILVLLGIAILSCYVGVVVSFNLWGT